MNVYQKAIKVRKECESRKSCEDNNGCPYFGKCNVSEIIFSVPYFTSVEELVEAIVKEKWNVK